MKHVYAIPGTGVPKNIRTDLNYQLLLRQAFNRIFDDTTKRKIVDPVIIFSGGQTDCWPPYKRSEAAEMAKLFKTLMAGSAVRKYTRQWRLRLEDRSLSSLENHLFVKRLVGSRPADITWFAEITRVGRHTLLGRRIFGRRFRTVGIDYDVSANRYRLGMIDEREKMHRAYDLWALRSPANQRAHHHYYVERRIFLRSFSPSQHVEAVHQWCVTMAIKKLPPTFRAEATRRGLIS
jgi:hypothetical protein